MPLSVILFNIACSEKAEPFTEPNDTEFESDVTEGTDGGDEPDHNQDDTAVETESTNTWSSGIQTATTLNQNGNALVMDIWYPTTETQGTTNSYEAMRIQVDGNALIEAKPDCSEPRPVIVHSHGNSSIRWELFWWTEFLASQGWIVVAPDHPGNNIYSYPFAFNWLVFQRPYDIQNTYDWLLAQNNDPESFLYQCVNPDGGYVVSGYSFGGYTAYAVGGALVDYWGVPTFDYSDYRAKAIITFAPWTANIMSTGTENISVPVLSFGAAQDDTVGTDYQTLFASMQTSPRWLGAFPNGGHYSFTSFYCISEGDGCGNSYVDPELVTTISNQTTLAFLRYINGDQNALHDRADNSNDWIWEVLDTGE